MTSTLRPLPRLLMLKGYPGSGKSTVASALSREFGWPVIDKDEIQDSLDPLLPASDGPTYTIMFRVARRQLLHGLSVVCDSPLWKQTYANARSLAAETGATLLVVDCRCSDKGLWQARIASRRGMELPARRTTTWSDLEAYVARYDAEPYKIDAPYLAVDTARSLPEILADLRAWLREVGNQALTP